MAKKKGKKRSTSQLPEDPELQQHLESLKSARDVQTVQQYGREVLHRDPLNVEAIFRMALFRAEQGKPGEATAMLQRSALLAPERTDIMRALVANSAKAGQWHTALAAARRWVQLAPKDSFALSVLAGIYGTLKHESYSMHLAQQAANAGPLSVKKATSEEKMRVLSLGTIASGSYKYIANKGQLHTSEGHNNLVNMLDGEHITLHRLCVDALKDNSDLIKKLPQADLIYNSITDPNRCSKALEYAARICDKMSAPVVNHPREVLKCTREGNWERLKDAPGIIMPKSICLGELKGNISDTIRKAAEEHNLRAPVIMRAGGFQGGKHMHLLSDLDNLNVTLKKPAVVYLIEFHDVSYEDERIPGHRLYPKYRAFLVGDKLYPAHRYLAFDDYMVHRKSYNIVLASYPWQEEEEHDYILDPFSKIEPQAWENLRQALLQLNLEYLGVDFAPATDPFREGNLVIFETNPAMRNRLADRPPGHPMHTAYYAITYAAHELFCKRAGVAPWQFQLPASQPGLIVSENGAAQRFIISGKVQGVGYRNWFSQILKKNNMHGWIRNLTDGRVEAVVHGSPQNVEQLSQTCKKGPNRAQVKNVDVRSWEHGVPEGVLVLESGTIG